MKKEDRLLRQAARPQFWKRCPFCGNTTNASSGGIVSCECGCCKTNIYCEKCGAQGPTADNHTLAVEYWNTRRKRPGPEKPWDIKDIGKSGRWYGK